MGHEKARPEDSWLLPVSHACCPEAERNDSQVACKACRGIAPVTLVKPLKDPSPDRVPLGRHDEEERVDPLVYQRLQVRCVAREDLPQHGPGKGEEDEGRKRSGKHRVSEDQRPRPRRAPKLVEKETEGQRQDDQAVVPGVKRVQGKEEGCKGDIPPSPLPRQPDEKVEEKRHGLVAGQVQVLEALLEVVGKEGEHHAANEGRLGVADQLAGKEVAAPAREDKSEEDRRVERARNPEGKKQGQRQQDVGLRVGVERQRHAARLVNQVRGVGRLALLEGGLPPPKVPVVLPEVIAPGRQAVFQVEDERPREDPGQERIEEKGGDRPWKPPPWREGKRT